MYKLKNDAQQYEESNLDQKIEALNELFIAIESARNALSIYQSDNHTKNTQNIYGIAL